VSVAVQPPALRAVTGTITRHKEQLVLGTEDGLWRVRHDTVARVATKGEVYTLLSTSSGLLGAGADGLFVYRDGRVRSLVDSTRGYALHRSRRDSSVVYASTFSGALLRLRREAGRWRIVDRTDRVDMLIPTIGQTPDGALWLGTGIRGMFRLTPPLDDLEAAPMVQFDTSNGLPHQNRNFVTQLGDSVRFSTREGLYLFEGGRFKPDPRFESVYADGVRWSWFAELGPHDGVWIDFGGHKLGVATGWPGDALRWVDRPFRRVADIGDVWSIYPDRGPDVSGRPARRRDSLIWFGAEGALVRYDRRLQRYGGHNQPFRTLIRGVQVDGDSLLYGGDEAASSLPAPVAYEHDRFRFQFGSTSFEQIEGPMHNWDRPRQYRWRLAGLEDEWTDWTVEPQVDYTSLPPGQYTIRVEARNLYQVVGGEATLSFRVLPPWYRTWWAYGGYALLALGLVGGVVQWRTRRLRRRQEELEATVTERTEQIRQKNDELARQAEKLKELDAAKRRLFANVSHEFRTPLTLIRGPVQEVRKALQEGTIEGAEHADQLAVAERNTARLRRLVDQILGLARVEAGSYELAARATDLGGEVKRIARSFEPLAERHGLTFQVDTEEADDVSDDAEPVYVDREALEHILGNLLSNAIKFTPEDGRVDVVVTGRAEHVEVGVSDTGPGIPEDQQDAIFDRFAQGEEQPAGDAEGLGIGLAFAKDLVDLHGGTIELESEEGAGTTVVVRLPRGCEHLSDDQLVGASTPPEEGAPERSAAPPDAVSSTDPWVSTFSSSPSTSASSPSDDRGAIEEGVSDDPSQFDPRTSKVVLVVDDNADVRRYVRSVLTPKYAVIEAADGERGLAAAREQLPDVILADVMMPEMDGHEMVRRLKDDSETEAIPTIMVTARAETSDEVTGLEVGADDYVTKPFDADVLRARVDGMISVQEQLRRRIREELRRRGDGSAAGDPGGDRAPESAGDRSADAEPPRLVVPTAATDECEFVRTVREAIEEHLADPDLDVDRLADAVAVSRSTLYRRLKDEIGTPPSEFIRQVRLEHGARLLREEKGTVSEVAYAVGFSSLSYFSRSFREHVGQSPSEYANR
jgi:signal transduction histidine kinase/CheY-like chemotaxis protein